MNTILFILLLLSGEPKASKATPITYNYTITKADAAARDSIDTPSIRTPQHHQIKKKKLIHTGPKGGKYYLTPKKNKSYLERKKR